MTSRQAARVGMWVAILVCVWQTPAVGQSSGRRAATTRSDDSRPLVLFGNVEMEDGSPLPGPVSIERVCNGSSRKEASTDSAGHFSFQVGSTMAGHEEPSDNDLSSSGGISSKSSASMRAGMPSLETSPVLNRRALIGCELRASASGFASTHVDLGRFQNDDVGNVGTIFLERRDKTQGTTISVTTYQAPKDAKKAYERAAADVKKERLDEARAELEKAVAIYPKYAAAWNDLGRVLQEQRQFEAAEHAYKQALEADPRFVAPYFPLAQLAAQRKKWQEVVEFTQRGLEMDPLSHPEGYFYNAVAQYNLGNLEEAEKAARRGERFDQQQQMPRLHLVLSAILAQRKNYAEAAEELKSYLKLVPEASDSPAVKAQLENLEKLNAASPASSRPR